MFGYRFDLEGVSPQFPARGRDPACASIVFNQRLNGNVGKLLTVDILFDLTPLKIDDDEIDVILRGEIDATGVDDDDRTYREARHLRCPDLHR